MGITMLTFVAIAVLLEIAIVIAEIATRALALANRWSAHAKQTPA